MRTVKFRLSSLNTPIYLISDLHSNLPALVAVLNEIPSEAIIVCAGDIVGYYLEPNEVCDLLQARSVLCIQGNHDKYVLGGLTYPINRESKYRIISTLQVLSSKNLRWLSELPDCLLLEFDQASEGSFLPPTVQVVHGSPRNVEEYIYPDTPIDFLAKESVSYLVLGHTHHPMMRQAGARIVVNPGSVGQTRDKKPGASYASIDLLSGFINFYRASYPIFEYQKRLKDAKVDDSMINILSRGIE